MSQGRGALKGAERLVRVGALVASTLARSVRIASQDQKVPDRTALLAWAARRALEIHGLEVRASGAPPHGPALLVSNHLSYLDPLVLLSQAPCVPISKSELASWPVLGAVASRTGVLFVDRGSVSSRLAVMRGAERVLRNGGIVLNFPEGTTTDGSTVLRFRKGLFEVARRLRIPITPCALRYAPRELAWTGDASFLPHYLRLARLGGATAEVTFGDPIAWHAYPTAERLAHAARACTLALLEAHPAWLRKAR